MHVTHDVWLRRSLYRALFTVGAQSRLRVWRPWDSHVVVCLTRAKARVPTCPHGWGHANSCAPPCTRACSGGLPRSSAVQLPAQPLSPPPTAGPSCTLLRCLALTPVSGTSWCCCWCLQAPAGISHGCHKEAFSFPLQRDLLLKNHHTAHSHCDRLQLHCSNAVTLVLIRAVHYRAANVTTFSCEHLENT